MATTKWSAAFPLAGAATTTRINGDFSGKIEPKPLEHPSSMRLHGVVIVSHYSRKAARVVTCERVQLHHQEKPRPFDLPAQVVTNPAIFHSYFACRDAMHELFLRTPVARDFDLAPDNWDHFMPDTLASMVLSTVRHHVDDMGTTDMSFVVDFKLTLRVNFIFSEPKALLLACKMARPWGFQTDGAQCAVCLEDLVPRHEDNVQLPCLHCFHGRCIGPWFHKATTCPMCQRDVMTSFHAVFPVFPPGRTAHPPELEQVQRIIQG